MDENAESYGVSLESNVHCGYKAEFLSVKFIDLYKVISLHASYININYRFILFLQN